LVVTGCMTLSGVLQGQVVSYSPYSRFGIGDLSIVSNIKSFSMGRTQYALRDPTCIYVGNPASYAAFDTLSFVFEGGITGQALTMTTRDLSEQSRGLNVSHLLFGFPVTRWWKSSLGLLPVSSVGYNIRDHIADEYLGRIRYLHSGEGGINQAYFGHAIRLGKHVSAGVNAAYFFGNIENSQTVTFPDSSYYIGTRTETSINPGDLYLTYGLQYETRISPDVRLVTGFVFSNAQDVHSKKTYLARSFLGTYNNVEQFVDTVILESDTKGSLRLPVNAGFGLSFENPGKWLLASDFQWQKWEDFKMFGAGDTLENSLRFSLGGNFIPDKNNLSSYWKRINYRLGLRYSKSNLNLRGNQLNEFGISFGLGLPIKKSKTAVNLGIEIGSRGTTDNDLIRENFINFSFAVSVFEQWFIKPKYY